MTDHPLHLAVALSDVGWHPAAWREDPDGARRLGDPEHWAAQVRLAEEGLLDLVTIEDGLGLQTDGYGPQTPRTDRVRGRVDAVLLASRIAPLTSRIGIVPTVVTAHTEPFHVATALQTLDFVSTGRAGVRLTAGPSAADARLVGVRTFPDFTPDRLDDPEIVAFVEDLFAEAGEHAEVLRRLWDSWEDGAEIRDVPTGRFIDRDRLHYADFRGRFFSVKGPSIVPRSPQGQPPVAILAHGPLPYRLGAQVGDVLFVTPHGDDDLVRILSEVRAAEEEVRRPAPPQLVLGDLVVVLDDDPSAARGRLDRLDALSGEAYASDARIFAGSPAELADLIEAWHRAGYAGVRLRPAATAVDLPQIVHGVVPELQRRGLFRTAYEADTLRGHLGLDRPLSRYARTPDLVEAP
ncbi:LLM class flavin-dependent oxidoreductase [Patulibacter sp. NPDC049589]|uniref:LLM class flavin-dependent oxidoreductase n=1 Tax=Patulibacter sp. NPDC049589 TaxID=3154731 RepID=UPI00342BDE7E